MATASLELGVDLGRGRAGVPDRLAALVLGRASSASAARATSRGATPKGRLFPLTRDELLECAAFVRGMLRRRLDRIEIPSRAARHPVPSRLAAACASTRRSGPRTSSSRSCAAPGPTARSRARTSTRWWPCSREGFAPGRPGQAAPAPRRRQPRRCAAGAARGSRRSPRAAPSPTRPTTRSIAEPERGADRHGRRGLRRRGVGQRHLHAGHHAAGAFCGSRPAGCGWPTPRACRRSVPFWLGEAPGRTPELSEEVSLLRKELEPRLARARGRGGLARRGGRTCRCGGAVQAVTYLARGQGGARDAAHARPRSSPSASSTRRAACSSSFTRPSAPASTAASASRCASRFCKTFDFELQAAATDDAVLLSLGPQHSFPLETIFEFVSPETVRETLTAAALLAPMFAVRWRWTRPALAGAPAAHGRQAGPARTSSACGPTTCWRRSSRSRSPARRTRASTGRSKPPDHPLVNETLTRLPAPRRWISTGCTALLRAHAARRS